MGMVPHKEFTTGSEILANAAAVRERLMNPKRVVVRDEDASMSHVARLENEIEVHKRTIQQQAERIERMKLDMSDMQAAILSQAHMLIDTFRASSGETERVMRRSPRQIIEGVLSRDFPNVSFSDIVGPRRTRELVEPRHRCMVAVYTERADLSLPQIGKIFERDHTTIISALRKFNVKRSA